MPVMFQHYEIRACVDFGDETRSYLGKHKFHAGIGANVSTPAGALAEATAEAEGRPVFWTLYGRDQDGMAQAICDRDSFDGALEIMQAILLPFRLPLDDPNHDMHSVIDDICNQSSSEERL